MHAVTVEKLFQLVVLRISSQELTANTKNMGDFKMEYSEHNFFSLKCLFNNLLLGSSRQMKQAMKMAIANPALLKKLELWKPICSNYAPYLSPISA